MLSLKTVVKAQENMNKKQEKMNKKQEEMFGSEFLSTLRHYEELNDQ